MIIGRDLLEEHLGIKFLFDIQMMEWDNASTPMQDLDQFHQKETFAKLEHKLLYMHDPDTTEVEGIQEILDTKYCKANLDKLTQENKELPKEEQQKLLTLLKRHEQLFNGTMGTWSTDLVKVVLNDFNCSPCHAKPYHVPHSQEKKLREEVERLCKQGILRKIIRLNWHPLCLPSLNQVHP